MTCLGSWGMMSHNYRIYGTLLLLFEMIIVVSPGWRQTNPQNLLGSWCQIRSIVGPHFSCLRHSFPVSLLCWWNRESNYRERTTVIIRNTVSSIQSVQFQRLYAGRTLAQFKGLGDATYSRHQEHLPLLQEK